MLRMRNTSVRNSSLLGAVEKVLFSGGRGDTPLDWKSNPPVPPCQGGKSDAPRRGGGRKAPLTRGVGGLLLRGGAFSTAPPRSELAPHRLACGLAPLPRRHSLPLQSAMTLKGGVIRILWVTKKIGLIATCPCLPPNSSPLIHARAPIPVFFE